MHKADVTKMKKEPLFRISKRSGMPTWQTFLIRGATVLGGLIFILLLSSAVLTKSPFLIVKYTFKGTFGTRDNFMIMFRDLVILMMIALALTPAFKMKFWNIGAEGQVLISGFACCMAMWYFGGKIANGWLILVMLIFAIIAGVVWSVIPAVFKALWNTNETLFTLMMNYLAIQVIKYFIKIWDPVGTGSLAPISFGNLPKLGASDNNYWISIIVAVIILAFTFVYLRFSKHGYELTVVGESERTAKYIGINVKKVIIRTLAISGVICGIVGFLLVGGIDHMVSESTVGGRGFTAVLVSWLAQFNPFMMALTSFLVVFMNKGMTWTMQSIGITNEFFSKFAIGLLFLIIIAGEFLIQYKVNIRGHKEVLDKPNIPDSDLQENKFPLKP